MIRGHELRKFVEETTPGDQYKGLANWFGLDPLLKIQQNLRTLRRRVRERADSTVAADERSRDLTLLIDGEVVTWDEQGVCNWFNNNILAALDDSLAFTSFSRDDPTLAILSIRKEAEQEQLGLAQLRRASSLLKELDSPPEGTDKEHGVNIVSFEWATLRLREAIVHEGVERSKASDSVFSQVWNDAKKLFDDVNILGICPVCDTDLSVGPHGSHAGVRTSIDARLSGLADYREAEQELDTSRRQVGQSLESLRSSVGAAITALVDVGYVDPFVAPEQTRHGRVVPPAPRGRIPSHLSPRDRMRRKLQTRRGRQRYALRMQTVEPVFGQIKQGRGFRQFLLRGLEKVNGEWSLICTGHNLLKLFRFGVNLHRKARVHGPAQRIRNFCRGSEHGAIRKAIWGLAGAAGTISCRDPLSLTRKNR